MPRDGAGLDDEGDGPPPPAEEEEDPNGDGSFQEPASAKDQVPLR